jgi:hypothetical protein
MWCAGNFTYENQLMDSFTKEFKKSKDAGLIDAWNARTAEVLEYHDRQSKNGGKGKGPAGGCA